MQQNERFPLFLMIVLLCILVAVLWFGWTYVTPYTPAILLPTPTAQAER